MLVDRNRNIFIIFSIRKTIINHKLVNISIVTNLEKIVELDNRELEYNYLCFDINELHWNEDFEFYVENDEQENTATLYFYMTSESNIEKIRNKNRNLHNASNLINTKILLYPELCNTDKINKITKVCYLIYNYKHINKMEFEEAKISAITLWRK